MTRVRVALKVRLQTRKVNLEQTQKMVTRVRVALKVRLPTRRVNLEQVKKMVTLTESMWNDLVSDIYRIKKLIPVIVYQNTSSTSVV